MIDKYSKTYVCILESVMYRGMVQILLSSSKSLYPLPTSWKMYDYKAQGVGDQVEVEIM